MEYWKHAERASGGGDKWPVRAGFKKAKEPMAVVPKALYKFEDVRNLLAFSPLRRPRMNLEEEGDKNGAIMIPKGQ